MLPEGTGRLLAALNDARIPYVVIGGVAVNLLGYSRSTGDVDVLVPADRAVASRLRELLDRLGATRPDGSALPDLLFDGTHHIRARSELGVLDVIPEGDPPLDFADLRRHAQPDEADGTLTWRAGLAHLVALKRLADRPRDRDDLAHLEEAYGTLPDPPS
jgi:hypothetical protein